MKSSYSQAIPYITKDGSEIRELMHPGQHGNVNASLAEARIAVGATTVLHRHVRTEEIYYIVQGQGRMCLGDDIFDITIGDSICIAPGVRHNVCNTGTNELVILCVCAPAYAHSDTELLR